MSAPYASDHCRYRVGMEVGRCPAVQCPLQTDKMVDTSSDTRPLIITICNYDQYQAVKYQTRMPVQY
jgi:hypothetical protein